VQAARKIYSGPRNPRTTKQIYPGYEPGAEAVPGNWPTWIVGKLPNGGWQFSLGNVFFTDMVFESPKWDFRSFNFDRDVEVTDAKLAGILNSTNPALRRFKANGGKLIQYHGWVDSAIAPLNSVNYYKSVVREMGGLKKTQEFYRLYMVPGMSHCAGGPGPNSFGGILQNQSLRPDAENDVVDAMEQWVERGVAPDKIVATKFKNDDPKKDVVMTRPLCPYPQNAKWDGKGSTNDAASFICR
jgi:feruloyl esterase